MDQRELVDRPVVCFGPGSDDPGDQDSLSPRRLRAALLRQTLVAWSRAPGHRQRLAVCDIADDAGPVSDLAALSAFEPPRDLIAPHVFVGLVNAAEAHLGRNFLLLTQPLERELADFAARNGGEDSLPPLWWRDILRNYDRVVLFDVADFGQSAGFAPWARLTLVEDFLLAPPAPPDQADSGAVLVINHGASSSDMQSLYAPLGAQVPLWLLDERAPLPAPPGQLFQSMLHIHHGFDPGRPALGLHPADSVACGADTIVVAGAAPVPEGEFTVASDDKDAVRLARAAAARLARSRKVSAGLPPEVGHRRQTGARRRAAQFRNLSMMVMP